MSLISLIMPENGQNVIKTAKFWENSKDYERQRPPNVVLFVVNNK